MRALGAASVAIPGLGAIRPGPSRARRRTGAAVVLAGLLTLAAVPSPVLCQGALESGDIALQGTVRDSASGEGVGQALVQVSGPTGETLAFAVTDDHGAFRFELHRVKAYELQASKLGFSSESVLVRVPRDRTRVSRDIRLAVDPLALRELRVSIEGRCQRRRSDSPLDAYEAYARALPFLRSVAAAEAEERLAYRLALSEKLNVRNPRRLIKQHGLRIAEPDTVVVATPLWSPSAEELGERGYVVAEGGGVLRYYAPRADVLASESFRTAHCFWVEKDSEDGELLVGFEPEDADRSVPDVSGVIRMDRQDGIPVSVEFEYESARDTIAAVELPGLRRHMEQRASAWSPPKRVIMGPLGISNPIGGRLTFGEVVPGLLATREWELRIPVVYSISEFSRGKIQVWPQTLERTRKGRVLEVLKVEVSSGDP